jgi:hypothetical protein
MSQEQKQATLDLSGLQQVVHGVIQAGDILVYGDLRDYREALPCEIGCVINGDRAQVHFHREIMRGVVVYRAIPGPRHMNVEAGAPTPEHETESGYEAILRFNEQRRASRPQAVSSESLTDLHSRNGAAGKPSNPKDLLGSDKLPIHLWPTTATALGCLGLLDGMLKYGRSNFRAVGVRASIYFDAANRHLNAWFEGENEDKDSGLCHLAHALACIAIIVDARAAGKLTDDRMFPGGYRAHVESLTPHVARLKARYADRDPKHYTVADREEGARKIIEELRK